MVSITIYVSEEGVAAIVIDLHRKKCYTGNGYENTIYVSEEGVAAIVTLTHSIDH
jgi:hypothetical protein